MSAQAATREQISTKQHAPPPAVVETHISTVFLTGDRAYKLKKPVYTGFLDFRSGEARQLACWNEVALNRRLAPDVYLGVAGVTDSHGAICDHLVVMRRMPAERSLSALLRGGADIRGCLRAVARTMAAFHERAERGAGINRDATAEAVRALWDTGFAQLRRFVGGVLDAGVVNRAQSLAGRYLAGRALLFERRIEEGNAVDGHGDLLADDIYCLEDGPRILDCLEFDPHLRHGDVLLDVAMLAMDLERLGRSDLGTVFLHDYVEFSGRQHPISLAHHYVAYRAFVRCKIACLRHEQGDSAAAEEARSLLEIAVAHLERSRVVMLLVGGLPGTGKTTLATAAGDAFGWAVLRTDRLRKESRSARPPGRAGGFERGEYAPARVARTYGEMLHRAEGLLRRGESVVLDATWRDGSERDLAELVATRAGAVAVEVNCIAPPAVCTERLMQRRRQGSDLSDVTATVAQRIAVGFDPWPGAVQVDTTLPLLDQVDRVSEIIEDL